MLESQSSFLSTPFGQKGQANRKSSLWLSSGQNLRQGAKILVVSNREEKIEPNPVLPRQEPALPSSPRLFRHLVMPTGPQGKWREETAPLQQEQGEDPAQAGSILFTQKGKLPSWKGHFQHQLLQGHTRPNPGPGESMPTEQTLTQQNGSKNNLLSIF